MMNARFRTGLLAAVVGATLTSAAVAGPVKISQVYGAALANSAGSVNGDYVELVNTGALPVDMSNWSVSIATGLGTYAWTKINIPAGTILEPNRHYTLRLQTVAGGIIYNQDQTGASANLAVANGAVAVMANQIALTAGTCPTADPDLVDVFGYGTSLCHFGAAASAAAHTAGSNQAFTRNTDGCANTSDNAADFTSAAANPRTRGGLAGAIAYSPTTPVQVGQTLTFNGAILGVSETVCGGSPVPSTGQAATLDLSELGGSATQLMTPTGGGAFTFDFTIPASATGGVKTVRAVGSDAQGRTISAAFPIVLAIVPVPDVDLGTLVVDAPTQTDSRALTGGAVHWYKFAVAADVSVASNTYLDIDTEGSLRTALTVYDTYLSLFDSTGVVRAFDDDDGSGLQSQLSFGATTPARPAQNTNNAGLGLAYNGRDGTLVAGTYYLAAYGYANAVGSPAAGWLVQSTSVQDGTVVMNLKFGTAVPLPPPTPPTADVDFGVLSLVTGLYNDTRTLTTTAIKWYKFTVPADISVANNTYLDIDTEGSLRTDATVYDTYLSLFDISGAVRSFDDDDGSGLQSQLSYGQTTPVRPAVSTNGAAAGAAYNGRDGTLTAGIYYLAAYGFTNAAGSPGAGFIAASTSAQDGTLVVNMKYATPVPPAPPASFVNIGTLASDGVFITRTGAVAVQRQVNWYKFTLASGVDRLANTYIDLDTETSTVPATAMGLFKASDGTLIVSDTIDGTDTLSQISIGRSGRPALGNGLAYNGRDGATLAADDYFVAVTSAAATFASGWQAASTNTTTGGNLVLRIRTGTQGPIAPPANALDIGTLHGDKTVDTENGQPIASPIGAIKWFKFVTPQDANNTTGKYLDIDCDGSILSAITARLNDTEIGVYTQGGVVVAIDDDGGVDWTSLLTFGDTANPRPIVGNGTARNGNDGVLPAGTYYLAFGGFNVTYNVDFDATTTNTTGEGTIILHLNNNFDPTGPAACNLADVAGLGGSVGPDGALTADDIIVYLDAFFAGNLAIADIAVLGGTPGHDGQLTADDLILFLGQFFAPCNP